MCISLSSEASKSNCFYSLKISAFFIIKGSKSFSFSKDILIPLTSVNSKLWDVAVVDVNSDSKPDIIVTNADSDNVGVLLNTGTGTFAAQTTYETASNPSSVAVVDVNNDRNPDIIVTNYLSSNVTVLLNTGNGIFTTKTTYEMGSNPSSVLVVDVNSDSKPDIIVADSIDNSVTVLLAC